MATTISLQKRLVYGLTLGVTVLWLVATALSGLVVQRELNKAFDNAMLETAQRLLPLAVLDIFNRDDGAMSQQVASLDTQQAGFSYLVRDNEGMILLRSQGADTALFDPQPLQGFTTSATHRLFGASALRDTLFLQIAEPLAHRREAVLQAVVWLLLPLLFLIPVSLLGIWWFVRFNLRSVQSYRYAIETRGAGNLLPLHVEKLPVEISSIADAVNHLLERLRHALEAERRFAENSAHELRTPLASALAQTQRLIREVPEGPLRTRATQIEGSLRELARLSEKLLQLAKAEGGGLLVDVPQDLNLLLSHVVQDMQQTARVPIKLTVPPTASVFSFIDPDIFAILVRNLLENALKHGSQGSAVEISLSRDGRLTVVNAGPVVSAANLAKLPQRFVRSDKYVEGFGLGLAIVSSIVRGVGAELMFSSPATGKADGFEVIVQFSLAS